MDPKMKAAIEEQQAAHARMQTAVDELDKLITDPDATSEQRDAAQTAFEEAETDFQARTRAVERFEAIAQARSAAPRELPPAEPRDKPEDRADLPYRPDNSGASYFRDLRDARSGDVEARERLVKNNRHRVEVATDQQRAGWLRQFGVHERAGLTQAAGAGGELIPPLWLDEYVPYLRAGRAFADQCMSSPLPPETNSINVPKISGGASVSVSSDAASVSNTDLTTTSVTAQVQTLSGRTVAAYQDIDLGYAWIDRMIYDDLLREYWKRLDIPLINGTVTNAKGILQVSGTNSVTYTDSTPTGPELYSPIFQAKSQIATNAFVEPDFLLMHPSTWNWYLSQLDGSNLPLALYAGDAQFNRAAKFNENAQGVAGQLAGIPVVVDANVPNNTGSGTNQAPIAMCNRQTLVTYESTPTFKVADQTSIATLQYQFVLYGYYACAFGRLPAMVSVINGTGLIIQTGF